MTSFIVINAFNAHYTVMKDRLDDLNFFAILELSADDMILTVRNLRLHFRSQMIQHVFKRINDKIVIMTFQMSRWQHVNIVKNLLKSDELHAQRLKWVDRFVQIWNSFAKSDSSKTLRFRDFKIDESDYMQYQCLRCEQADMIESHAVSIIYHQLNVENVENENLTHSIASHDVEISSNFFIMNSDDETFSHRLIVKLVSFFKTARSRLSVTFSVAVLAIARSRLSVFYEIALSHSLVISHRSRVDLIVMLSSSYFSHLLSDSRRHVTLREIYLEIWNRFELHAVFVNVVYEFRNRKNRINRRVFKKDHSDQMMLRENFDVRRTACKHEHIDYIVKYQDMIKKQIDVVIMFLLRAVENESESKSLIRWEDREE